MQLRPGVPEGSMVGITLVEKEKYWTLMRGNSNLYLLCIERKLLSSMNLLCSVDYRRLTALRRWVKLQYGTWVEPNQSLKTRNAMCNELVTFPRA